MATSKKLKAAPAKKAVGAPTVVAAPESPNLSRYQRFQQILDGAAGKSTASYGGLGACFWKTLERKDLLEARIEEIRLIAPEKPPVHSCCAPKPETEPALSRAERSGLIGALRGLPPFDGSRFPRMMWGGATVSDENIEFIAHWINDGLPDTGRGTEIKTIEIASGLVSITREEFAVFEGRPTSTSISTASSGSA